MLTAKHHQVTCYNENPFSPHYCADDRHFLCDISGGRRGGESGGSSSYYREHSVLFAISNYYCSPRNKEGRALKGAFQRR